MRKYNTVLSILSFLLFNIQLSAQTTILFDEGFETLPLQMHSSGSSSWDRNNTFQFTGTYSDSATLVSNGDTAILTSNAIDISGYTNIKLSFDQICKVDFVDGGYVEVSTDSGLTWTQLIGIEYKGTGQYSAIGNKFSSVSYPLWLPASNTTPPTNSWWKSEVFNLNNHIGNYTNFMVRFSLRDGNNNGSAGSYGWLIDNVKIIGSNGELDPPSITLLNPILVDTVYGAGPFDINAEITDSSGILSAKLFYTINNIEDSIIMTNTTGNKYLASIPSQTYFTTISYHIEAIDSSVNYNKASYPDNSEITFTNKEKPSVVIIGGNDGQSSFISPIYNGSTSSPYNHSDHVSLIEASELNSAFGNISALSFIKNNSEAYNGNDGHLQIYIKNTSATIAPSDSLTYQNELAGATLVYEDTTVNISAIPGYINYVFNQNTFYYNGTSNIMVFVRWYRPSSLTTSYLRWNCNTASGKALTLYGSTANPNDAQTQHERPNMRLLFTRNPIPYDVALDSVINPQHIVNTNNATPIDIRLRNDGDSLLVKATINWELDSILQTPYIWTGSMEYGIVSNNINIGTHSFSDGFHNLKVWASLPNDSIDGVGINDTIQMSFFGCSYTFNGTYTVGGQAADFATISDLFYSLNNCGLSGPTEIKINPGVYLEGISITDNIPGLDSINTLTFTSSTNNAQDVIIKNTLTNSGSVFLIDNIGNINLKNLSIIAEGTDGNTISIKNNVSNILIKNCIIKMDQTDNNAFVISIKGKHDNIVIKDCSIEGGYYSINVPHSTSSTSKNIKILNNTFKKFYRTSIYVSYSDFPEIINNKIIGSYFDGQPNQTSINISHCPSATIIGNESVLTTDGPAYGIYIYYSSGSPSQHTKVYNNISIVKGNSSTTSFRAFYLNSSSNVDILNNTFVSYSGSSSSQVLYITNNGKSGIVIKNNIIAAMGGTYTLYATTSSTSSVSDMDYNAYFTSGSTMMKWGTVQVSKVSGITGIQNATSMDTHSIVTNPMLYSESNARSFSANIQSAALVIADITTDIDNNLRSTTTPSIGAFEFKVAPIDVGVLEIIEPLAVDTQNRVLNIIAKIRNFGSDTVNSINIKYSLDGNAAVNHSWTGTLVPSQMDTITIASITLPSLDYQLKVFTEVAADTTNYNDTATFNYYALPLIDAKLVSLDYPINGCEKDTAEIVQITILNNGLEDIYSGLSVSYQVEGSSNIVSETITDTLYIGQSMTYEFNQKIDMYAGSTDSTFIITTAVHHSQDPLFQNDSLENSIVSLGLLQSPTISDTTINYGSSVDLNANSPYTVQWFEDDTSTNIVGVNIYTTPLLYDTTEYWLKNNTNVPSTNAIIGLSSTSYGFWDPNPYGSGPISKHQILYLASELTAQGLSAGEIESFAFQASSSINSLASFSARMANVNVSSLTTTYETVSMTDVLSGSVSSSPAGWVTHTLTTPFYWDGESNLLIELCVTGGGAFSAPMYYSLTTYNSYTAHGGMGTSCSDASASATTGKRPNTKFVTKATLGCSSLRVPVTVNVPLPQYDGNVSDIISPVDGCGLASTPISINIINMGTDTLYGGYTASYKINNGAFITPETVSSNIAPADTLLFTFNTIANLNPGASGTNYVITAAINNSNDTYSANDTLVSDSIHSYYTPTTPVVSNLSVPYSSQASLSGTASDSLFWFSDSITSQYIGTGNPYITDHLYFDDEFWVYSQRYISDSAYQIGTGLLVSGTAGPSPYGAAGIGSRQQYLIKASELKAMGLFQGYIKDISFEVGSVKANLMKNYTIKIGNTVYDDLNQTYFDSTLTKVYGPIGYVDVFGWNTHTFSSPFFWDGESNIIIETCFKGNNNLTYAGVKYTNTSFTSVAYNDGYGLFNCSTKGIATKSTKRPNIKITQASYGVCKSDAVKLDVSITNTPAVDASIVGFVAPKDSANSIIAEPIKVVIMNYGSSNLTSSTINWSDNNFLQTAYNWSGNLAQGETDTVTINSSYNFIGGVTELKAWISTPNDTVTYNDTTTSSLIVKMSGTYSIGTNNSNYSTISDATNDLDICGISGAIVFNIDSAYYGEKVTINKIAGSSQANTITFQSSSMDSTNVIISSATTPSYNYTILLRGAEYINFKNLTLKSQGSEYGNVIVIEDGAKNISIENCIINSTNTTTNSPIASGFYIANNSARNITINNNIFNNGFKAINITNTYTGNLSNISITNNIFNGYIKFGIYTQRADSINIENNKLTDIGGGTSVYGIYSLYGNYYDIINNDITLKSVNTAYGIYNTYAEGTADNHNIIANNRINSTSGTGTKFGMYFSGAKFTDIIYNSINLVTGSSTTASAIKITSGNTIKVLNNNLYSPGYAFYTNSPNALTQIDYNNYYTDTTNASFVYWGNSNIQSLALLQAYSPSQNIHSKNVDPEFYGNTDLHSQQLDIYNAGTPYANITTDMDGEIRSTTAPSIGADEFTPPNIDLGNLRLISPATESCDFTSSENIIINIKNIGLNNLNFASTPATITVYILGVNPDTITYNLNSGTLNSGMNADYTISSNYDLSASGQYVFKASVNINGDGNPINDEMDATEVISFPIISVFPFSEDFESGLSTNFRTESNIESNVSISSFAAANGSNFGLHFEGGIGNSFLNKYTIDQAFTSNTDHIAKAFSCNIDAQNINLLNLKFDLRQTSYSAVAVNYSSWLRILITDVNGTHYLKNLAGDSAFRPQTANFDTFTNQFFNLDDYTGQTFTLSFETVNKYKYGYGSFDGDNVLIDNIVIWSPISIDLGVNSIIQTSNFALVGTPTTVKVEVENYGLDTLYDIPLKYKANSGQYVYDTLFGSLAPQQQQVFTFSQTFNLGVGNSTVCVISNYPNDAVAANDTACAIFKGLQNFYPNYSDDFEGSDDWVSAGTFNQFQLGTPTTQNINSAHSGINAWVTELNLNYKPSATEFLYTPFFTILQYTDSISVEFWQFMRSSINNGYGTFEYSFDGVNWTSYGYVGYPGAINWYTTNVNGQHKWNMVNNSWIKSSIKLDPNIFNTGSKVQFRFKFESLSSPITDEGWAIDDFKLFFPPLQWDAGITEISTPSDSVEVGTSQNVTVHIKNFGSDTLSIVPLSFVVNGNTISESYSGTILPDSIVEYTFTTNFNTVLNTNSICAYTSLSTDMQHVNDTLCKALIVTSTKLDAGISDVITPNGQTYVGQQTEVKVMLNNYGTDTLYSIPVEYRVAGILMGQETFTGTLLPDDSVEYTFVTKYESPIGNYILCSKTILNGDSYNDNDSICIYLSGVVGIDISKAEEFAVAQNQPNPAKNSTTVEYYLPKSGSVQYKLTNLLGELIINSESTKSNGLNNWKIDTHNLKAGVYHYTITFDKQSITNKMVIIK